jgi:micrococcal nuclease
MGQFIAAILALMLGGAVSAGERCSALDGGTLQCGSERVKVEGITLTAGKEARQLLQQRVQGREVTIERRGRDKYGRTLGRLYVGGDRITQNDLTGSR